MKIEVALLTLNKNPVRTEFIYSFDNMQEALQFIDLTFKNGYEVAIRETKE